MSVTRVRANQIFGIPTGPSFPNPFLEDLIPDSHLPNNTGNFILKGSYFTPDMSITVEGQTLNYKTFISDNEVRVNLTTGAAEGSFDVTLNNGGGDVVFNDVLLIVLGTVYTPTQSDYTGTNLLDTSVDGELKIETFGSAGYAKWNQVFDMSVDWQLKIRYQRSELGLYPGGNDHGHEVIGFYKVSDNTKLFDGQCYANAAQTNAAYKFWTPAHAGIAANSITLNSSDTLEQNASRMEASDFSLKYINGVLYGYEGTTLTATFSDTFDPLEDLYMVFKNKQYNWTKIKYIELAT